MSINSIENAVRYSEELDAMFSQKSVTGFFADNNLAAKFVGAKTVMIPDVDFQGLADYDRDTGFSRGAITVSNTPYTMSMDRARSLQIDREDMDETGIASLAGKILGEYVKSKVVPECDAYVLSKLAGLANSRGNVITGGAQTPFETLCELTTEVRNQVGYDEELVAFVHSNIYALFQTSPEISRMLNVTEFKRGDVNTTVYSVNGVTLIPVVPERMKSAYTFNNNAAGGFIPAENAREIYMVVCPKKGVHLVKKTEHLRVFTPEQNLDADAYKFDYRIYYDVFVKKSGLDAVWTCVSPEIKFVEHPSYLGISLSEPTGQPLTAEAKVSSGEITYQWYICDDINGTGARKIVGATGRTYALPMPMEIGSTYYFVRATVDGTAFADSRCAEVEVTE